MQSNEQELNFRSLQKKKIIMPEKALVKRQHTIVNPTAFFSLRTFQKAGPKSEGWTRP